MLNVTPDEDASTLMTESGLDVRDLCKVISALWAVRAKGGAEYMDRVAEFALRVMADDGGGDA